MPTVYYNTPYVFVEWPIQVHFFILWQFGLYNIPPLKVKITLLFGILEFHTADFGTNFDVERIIAAQFSWYQWNGNLLIWGNSYLFHQNRPTGARDMTIPVKERFKKCNLTLAMSPSCHINDALIICWHYFSYSVVSDKHKHMDMYNIILVYIYMNWLSANERGPAWFYLLVPKIPKGSTNEAWIFDINWHIDLANLSECSSYILHIALSTKYIVVKFHVPNSIAFGDMNH